MEHATEKEAYEMLEQLGIPYLRVDHPAIVSVKNVPFDLPGPQVKNLLLKSKKGHQVYLVILPDEKQANLKLLAKELNEKHLTFAPAESLKELLGVPAGTVTPLALMHDTEKAIQVVIDQDIDKEDTVGFHPNINSTTLMIQFRDFEKVLAHLGYEPRFIEV